MPAKLQEVRELRSRVATLEGQLATATTQHSQEQHTAREWREKWNYQNFKLHLMVDMLALQALEGDRGGVVATGAGVQ
jgi:hypothetical protein